MTTLIVVLTACGGELVRPEDDEYGVEAYRKALDEGVFWTRDLDIVNGDGADRGSVSQLPAALLYGAIIETDGRKNPGDLPLPCLWVMKQGEPPYQDTRADGVGEGEEWDDNPVQYILPSRSTAQENEIWEFATRGCHDWRLSESAWPTPTPTHSEATFRDLVGCSSQGYGMRVKSALQGEDMEAVNLGGERFHDIAPGDQVKFTGLKREDGRALVRVKTHDGREIGGLNWFREENAGDVWVDWPSLFPIWEEVLSTESCEWLEN